MRNEREAALYKNVGRLCRLWREEQGISAYSIAIYMRYYPDRIYAFERGECDDYAILFAYIVHGMPFDAAEVKELYG